MCVCVCLCLCLWETTVHAVKTSFRRSPEEKTQVELHCGICPCTCSKTGIERNTAVESSLYVDERGCCYSGCQCLPIITAPI